MKGSHIWRSGKAKKKGGIGTHITAITKRRFMPNLQRVKAVVNGEVRYIRVTANAISVKSQFSQNMMTSMATMVNRSTRMPRIEEEAKAWMV